MVKSDMKSYLLFVLGFVMVFEVACRTVGVGGVGELDTTDDRTPVIIIADPGVDDAAGLLFALGNPKLDILGICANFGVVDAEAAAENVLRLLEVTGRVDVPVYIGANHPVGELELSMRGAGGGKDFHGPYGFGANALPLPQIVAKKDITAVEFIITTCRKNPDKISILIFSPPTTLALAVASYPQLKNDIKSVYMMGGALRVAGNTSPLAEANFANDAAASSQVIVAFSKKVYICPLDMTLTVLFSEPELERLKNNGGIPAKWYVEHLAPFYTSTYRKITGHFGMPIHDAHTVTALTNPELYKMEYLPVEVLVGKPGEYSHGMLLSDRRGGAAENDANGVGSSLGIGYAFILTEVDNIGFSNLWIDVVASLK